MPKMKEVKLGCCTNCDTKILDLAQKGSKRFLPNYREHEMELSNDSLFRVAVCADCKEILLHETEEANQIAYTILGRHKVWWSNNLPDNDHRKPNFHDAIEVADTNSNAQKFVAKVIERNAEKRRVRQWQEDKADFELSERKRKSSPIIIPGENKDAPIVLPAELSDYEAWKAKKGQKVKSKA